MSISVPQAVKEALQDGRMRNNYRFKVYRQEEYEIWTEVTTGITPTNKYTITTAGRYMADHVVEYLYVDVPATQSTPSHTKTIIALDGKVYTNLNVGEAVYPGERTCDLYISEGMAQRWVLENTLNNDKLVSESVIFDERMCSGDRLKFGLCEGSSLEFQYFDYDNINGCRIEAFIDVYYGEEEPYEIPMGWFDVVKCPVQASTGIRKVTAYNKLRSSYLDATKKVTDLIEEGEDGIAGSISVHKLLEELLAEDSVQEETKFEQQTNITRDSTITDPKVLILNSSHSGKYLRVIYGTVYLYTTDQDSSAYYRYITNDEGMWSILDDLVLYGYYTSGGTGLADYIRSSPAVSYTVGGYIVIDNTNGDRIFRSMSPFARYTSSRNTVTGQYTNHNKVGFVLPLYVSEESSAGSNTPTYTEIQNATSNFLNSVYGYMLNYFQIEKAILNQLEEVRLTSNDAQNVTIRDLQSAAFEVSCQFGMLDRVTDMFSGVTLNFGRLYPANSLYPADSLYPAGGDADTNPSYYSKLWTDSGGMDKFRYLIVTYKSGDEDKTLQRTVNADGTVDYNMSDNWLLRNLSWTDSQVGEVADAMVLLMKDITWFPFEMWASGRPDLETGDEIEITTPTGTYPSYILQRTLKGIQNLEDTYINGELDIF